MSALGHKSGRVRAPWNFTVYMSAVSQDQAAPLWRPPLYFDLVRINLDSTTPAMMAPAITRIVVRSMFIDYPFFVSP
jgi:hypothetical protein